MVSTEGPVHVNVECFRAEWPSCIMHACLARLLKAPLPQHCCSATSAQLYPHSWKKVRWKHLVVLQLVDCQMEAAGSGV